MKNIFIIAITDLKRIFIDKGAIVWMFVFPLIFTLFFGKAFPETVPSKKKIKVEICNLDKGPLGKVFEKILKQQDDGIQIIPVQDSTRKHSKKRRIKIPQDFTRKILEGKPVKVDFNLPAESDIEYSFKVKLILYKTIIKLIGALILSDAKNTFNIDEITKYINEPDNVKVIERSPQTINNVPGGYVQQISGSIVMFVMMILLTHAGRNLVQDQQTGTWRRLEISPISKVELITGTLIGRLLPALIQIFLLLSAGKYLFGVDMGRSLPALASISVIFAFTMSCMSLFISFIVKTREQATALGVLFTLVMASLGGCWWPIEIVSPFMQKIGFCFPSAWAMNGFIKVIHFQTGFREIRFNLLVLSSYAALFLIGSLWLIKYRKTNQKSFN